MKKTSIITRVIFKDENEKERRYVINNKLASVIRFQGFASDKEGIK